MSETQRGVVKWFSDKKGFGFIEDQKEKTEYFVHFTEIRMEGFQTLQPGARVNFEVEQTKKGPSAKNVVVL